MPPTDSSLPSVTPKLNRALVKIDSPLESTLGNVDFNSQLGSAGWQCKSFNYLDSAPGFNPNQEILAQIKSWAEQSETFHSLVKGSSLTAPLIQSTQQVLERAEGILEVRYHDARDTVSHGTDSLRSSAAQLRSQASESIQEWIEAHPETVDKVSIIHKQINAFADEAGIQVGSKAKHVATRFFQSVQQVYDQTERLVWATPQVACNFKEWASEVVLQGKEMAAATLEASQQRLTNVVHLPLNARGNQSDQALIWIADTGFNQDNPYIYRNQIQLGGDFIDNDANPLTKQGEGNEHGTGTLGIIQSLSPAANLFVSRVSEAQDVAFSIRQFVEKKQELGSRVAIFNLSSELVQTSSDGIVTLRDKLTAQEFDAIAEAQKHGVLLVVAAGNDDGAMSPWQQAAQFFDNIVVVGAADGGSRTNYSNIGVDLLAPGGTAENPIFTTWGNGVSGVAGTSAATAVVSSAITNIWNANVGLNYRQVKEILQNTATDVGSVGFDLESGSGILDLNSAVEVAKTTHPEALVPRSRSAEALDFWQSTEGAHAGLRPANWWSDISSTVSNAKNKADTAVQDAGKTIKQAATTVESTAKDGIAKVDKAVDTAVQDAGKTIKQAAATAKDGIAKVDKAVDTAVQDAGKTIKQAATTAKDGIVQVEHVSTELVKNLKMNIESNSSNIGSQFSQDWNDFSNSASEKGRWLIEQFNQGQKLPAESWKKIQSDLNMPDWLFNALIGAPDWENSGPRQFLLDKGKEFDISWHRTKPNLWGLGDFVDFYIGGNKQLWDTVDESLISAEIFSKLTNPLYRITHPEETEQTQNFLQNTFFGLAEIAVDISPVNLYRLAILDSLDMALAKESEFNRLDSWMERQWSRGSTLGSTIAKPYTDAWNSGHPGQAIGRAGVEIASLFIGAGEFKASQKGATVISRTADAIAIGEVKSGQKITTVIARTADEDIADLSVSLETDSLIANYVPAVMRIGNSNQFRAIRVAGLEAERPVGDLILRDALGFKRVEFEPIKGGIDGLFKDANGNLYIHESKVGFSPKSDTKNFSSKLDKYGRGGSVQTSDDWIKNVAEDMLKSEHESTRIAGQEILDSPKKITVIGTYLESDVKTIQIWRRTSSDAKTWQIEKNVKLEEAPD
jgi:hypothetical protein